MAYEKRGNRLYFYRKERIGGQVRSSYIGNGNLAETFAALDYLANERKQLERFQIESSRDFENEIDAEIDKFCEFVGNVTMAFLLVNGFHQHKRQWRRKRK